MRRFLSILIVASIVISAVVILGDRLDGSLAFAQTQPAAADAPPPAVMPPGNLTNTYNLADTLVLYGDMAVFWGQGNPENCILKSRYRRGEPVGFRMTAIDPSNGSFAETAALTVKVPLGDRVETLPMRYRGTGNSPRFGFWTAKWVVPNDAPLGVIRYTVEAQDSQGKTGVWAPYNIETSMLTITE
jgi:hypothetical protein